MFILLGGLLSSWICGFTVSIKFRKISTIMSSNSCFPPPLGCWAGGRQNIPRSLCAQELFVVFSSSFLELGGFPPSICVTHGQPKTCEEGPVAV